MEAAAEDADLTEKIMEYQRREYALLSKMAQRDREMRILRQQASEAAHAFEDTRNDTLAGSHVDAVVNIELAMLRQQLKEKDQETARLKEEVHNAQFQPNTIQGKKLLNKCTNLLEENCELGRQLGEDRLQVLTIQLTAERQKRLQLKKRVAELDQYAEQVDAENERMQKKIADLGTNLKDTRAMIEGHKKDIEEFNSGVKRKRDAAAPKAPEPSPGPSPQVEAAAAPPAAASQEQTAAEQNVLDSLRQEAAAQPAAKKKKKKKEKE